MGSATHGVAGQFTEQATRRATDRATKVVENEVWTFSWGVCVLPELRF